MCFEIWDELEVIYMKSVVRSAGGLLVLITG